MTQEELKAQEEAFWNSPLDEEEQSYEDNAENFVSAPEWVGKSLREAAKNPPTVHYSERQVKKPVTFRMDVADMDRIKQMAMEQGLQYQSLVGSILHRYAMGTLVDITEARKVFVAR